MIKAPVYLTICIVIQVHHQRVVSSVSNILLAKGDTAVVYVIYVFVYLIINMFMDFCTRLSLIYSTLGGKLTLIMILIKLQLF